MTGVREFGRYFEEFVKDYMKVVKELDLVEMECDIGGNRDIDIIGLKNNEIWIVECKEALTKNPSEHNVDDMKNKFIAIKEFTDKKFPNKTVNKFIAYITNDGISKENLKDIEVLSNVEFLDFKYMLIKLVEKTNDKTGLVTGGKYHWFFERLRRPDTKGCLDNLLSCLKTSK